MIKAIPKPKRVKNKGASIEKRCMELWGNIVRLRARGCCEKCGSFDRAQAHHVFTRSILSTRYLPDNGVCLCAGHHLFFAHKRPHEFRDWITGVRGQDWWDALRMRSNQRGKVEMYGLEAWLRLEHDKLSNGG